MRLRRWRNSTCYTNPAPVSDGPLQLLAALKTQPWFAPNLDGYFLAEEVAKIFTAGKQAHVPLLAGWNADEVRSGVVLAKQKATAQSFTDDTRKRYGPDADAILKAYPHATDAADHAIALAKNDVAFQINFEWTLSVLGSSQ